MMLIQAIFKSKPIITLSLPIMGEGRLGGGLAGETRPVKSGAAAARSVARFDAIKPNFSFQPGGGSGIKWRMQTIGACPRRAFAKLHLASNGPHSFESRAVAISTVSKLKEVPL
jgi:hypothetical protein